MNGRLGEGNGVTWDVIAFAGQMSFTKLSIWGKGCHCIYRSNEFHKAINIGKGMSFLYMSAKHGQLQQSMVQSLASINNTSRKILKNTHIDFAKECLLAVQPLGAGGIIEMNHILRW